MEDGLKKREQVQGVDELGLNAEQILANEAANAKPLSKEEKRLADQIGVSEIPTGVSSEISENAKQSMDSGGKNGKLDPKTEAMVLQLGIKDKAAKEAVPIMLNSRPRDFDPFAANDYMLNKSDEEEKPETIN